MEGGRLAALLAAFLALAMGAECMPDDDQDWAMPDPASLSTRGSRATAEAGRDADSGDAARVLEQERDRLMRLQGVTMVGETRDALGRSAIMIGVRSAADQRAIPEAIDGIPVVIVVTGEVDALHRRL